MKNPEVILFNASPFTSNLGVSALCRSTVEAMSSRLPGLRISIATFRPKQEAALVWDVPFPDNLGVVSYQPGSRRFWKDGSDLRTFASRFLPVLGGLFMSRFRAASAILDISGGDSFSDIYGMDVWKRIQAPKHLAISAGKPLILLPQTIGPFADSKVRAEAASIMRASSLVCARDLESADLASDCMGASQVKKPFSGVDMAFLLRQRCPADATRSKYEHVRAGAEVLVGLNISGLVWFEKKRMEQRGDEHRFETNYRTVMRRFVEAVASRSGHKVLLIPHVLSPDSSFESDPAASEELLKSVSPEFRDDVHILPGPYDESEVKWVIARCDWFAGARMHPTIAGLSTGVPTLNLAYSKKAKGVFASAGQGDSVADLRVGTDQEVLDAMLSHLDTRSSRRDQLRDKLPEIKKIADRQVDRICAEVEQ